MDGRSQLGDGSDRTSRLNPPGRRRLNSTALYRNPRNRADRALHLSHPLPCRIVNQNSRLFESTPSARDVWWVGRLTLKSEAQQLQEQAARFRKLARATLN